ncbi:4Fe-4S binding protein [Anaerovorax sp. IOR16]|uniref:4Fe-4S binding protein n=1 Tax=Anaerovorax sp. IOR16 TaxID=2773458 RepID=UPI0019D1992E|nr:4Fe-4S binding protein [Anaerovorax sp. IOR16]
MKQKKHWYDYLWIVTATYLILGFFNILFAWIGILCFIIPILFALIGGNKHYCNHYCGRGQLLERLGNGLRLSSHRSIPSWLRSKWFRYGFLVFFMTMFFNMLFSTYLVFSNVHGLREIITLFWTFKVPWEWTNTSMVSPWIAQFSFGFYSLMLTSTLLGLITMALYKPRSWCVYCPMGTMTQSICQLRHKTTSSR